MVSSYDHVLFAHPSEDIPEVSLHFCDVARTSNSRKELIPIPLKCAIRTTVPFKGAFAMDQLQQELDRLLGELAELDRCSARRGTNLAIAVVRRLMARR